MKLTIQAAPGELEEKADLVLERMLRLLPQDGLVLVLVLVLALALALVWFGSLGSILVFFVLLL